MVTEPPYGEVMSVPTDRKYLTSHEWFRPEGEFCTIGITQFAADELTDITYVDLPEVGTSVTAGETFGEVESVKATSDLYSGVSGEVVEINEELTSDPSLLNSDPHESGWMLKIKMGDPKQLDDLHDAESYKSATGAE